MLLLYLGTMACVPEITPCLVTFTYVPESKGYKPSSVVECMTCYDILSLQCSRYGTDKCTGLETAVSNVLLSIAPPLAAKMNNTLNVAGIQGCSLAAWLDGFHAPLMI